MWAKIRIRAHLRIVLRSRTTVCPTTRNLYILIHDMYTHMYVAEFSNIPFNIRDFVWMRGEGRVSDQQPTILELFFSVFCPSTSLPFLHSGHVTIQCCVSCEVHWQFSRKLYHIPVCVYVYLQFRLAMSKSHMLRAQFYNFSLTFNCHM
jgi:hypothetical protein